MGLATRVRRWGLALCLLALWPGRPGPGAQLATATLVFDPCAKQEPIVRGDGFVMGLALIPNANATLVAEILALQAQAAQAAQVDDMGVCSKGFNGFPGFLDYMASKNASVAWFRMKSDRLQVLRLPYADVLKAMLPRGLVNMTDEQLNATIYDTLPATVAIAFRGAAYSMPAYFGKAFTTTDSPGSGFVIALALLVKFEQGILQRLYWLDQTCDSCGGIKSPVCIRQPDVNSCATPLSNCTCAPNAPVCDYTDDSVWASCSTAINVGWEGTDVDGTVFRTGAQIQRINSFSLVGYFYTATNFITDTFDEAVTNVQANWNEIVRSSQEQATAGGSFPGTGRR